MLSWLNQLVVRCQKPWDEYSGETGILVVQNLHRYFMYVMLAYLPLLSFDVWLSLNFHEGDTHAYGVTVGSLILLVNVIMLTGYTFGCHAFRHVVEGCFARLVVLTNESNEIQTLKLSTKLNEQHKEWALYSLFWVMFADFYIYACTDPLFGWSDMIIWGGL